MGESVLMYRYTVLSRLTRHDCIGKPPVEVEIHVRELIESRPGFTLLAAGMKMHMPAHLQAHGNDIHSPDFKSIELRVLAHLCGDLQLLSAFNSSQATDIFIHLASEWLVPQPGQQERFCVCM